jgi:hypothetical protein
MKKSFLFLAVLMLIGSLSFAQMSDDDFEDISGLGPVESYLGFQFNIDMSDGNKAYIPSFVLGARQYFMPVTETIELGYVAFITGGLITEMGFGKQTIKSEDADYMYNFGVLVGASIRGDIASGLGFVADFGLAGIIDYANFQYSFWSLFGLPTKYPRIEVDLMNINIGVGLNAGLQYRLPMLDGASALIFEIGGNFSFCFYQNQSAELYWVEEGKAREKWAAAQGKPESASTIRIAPYLLFGWKF